MEEFTEQEHEALEMAQTIVEDGNTRYIIESNFLDTVENKKRLISALKTLINSRESQ
ncbi:hypothetical protein [Lactococcus lactis]|uniref:Uncharacterized protein n=1 Tax=Lactococcus lactis subsp. lactis A12 TaxID=1137134 RepID=S6EWI5_LACLL|nr:hypothetical protein [Lactococcus lactis]CDG03728.1 Putative uncharacterized protein [Lactococcus lactis subsp. lactis A12]SBW29619.1 Hypothetical protein LLA12_00444 [Lactococcus lactis subsp. lactis]